MSDAVAVALILGIPATITAVAALVTALRGLRTIRAVERAANGVPDQVLGLAREAGRGAGVAQERAESRQRHPPPPGPQSAG